MRSPFSAYQFLFLAFVAVIVIVVIQVGIFTMALEKLGLSAETAMLLLICTLVGSTMNLPLFSMAAEKPSQAAESRMRGLLFGRPLPFTGRTIVAINVGGALIPTGFSLYLIVMHRPPWLELLEHGTTVLVF